MVLSDWLEGLDYELLQGSLEVQVSDVSYDSRKAKEGDVFVCMTGTGGGQGHCDRTPP